MGVGRRPVPLGLLDACMMQMRPLNACMIRIGHIVGMITDVSRPTEDIAARMDTPTPQPVRTLLPFVPRRHVKVNL